MSILTYPNQTQPSKELLISNKIESISSLSYQIFKYLTIVQKQGIDLLWNDENLTPQEIINALGEDALNIFEMHSILTSALQQIAQVDGISADVALPTRAFEVVDGKIVVLDDPYTAR